MQSWKLYGPIRGLASSARSKSYEISLPRCHLRGKSRNFVRKEMPIWGFGLMEWINRKVVDPLKQIIKRGAEPKLLAFSTALGVVLGVFPICGTTVFLCGFAIGLLRSRCHAPTVMLANFVATPIELRIFWMILSTLASLLFSLVIPFLRLGEFMAGGPHFALSSDALHKVVTGKASREVLVSILHALLGWIIAAPFILGILYVVLIPCFKVLVRRPSSVVSSPTKQPYSHPEVKLKIGD